MAVTTNHVFSFDGTNWTQEVPLPKVLTSPGVAVFNARLYAVGGMSPFGITNVYSYDGTSWTAAPGLPSGRGAVLSAVIGDYLYAIGGMDGGASPKTNVYRFNGTAWSEVAGLPSTDARLCGDFLDGRLVIVGGYNASTNTLTYDGTNFTFVAGLPAPRKHLGAATVAGAFLAYGGTATVNPSNDTYRFNGTHWTQAVNMIRPVYSHGAATYQEQVYAVGGSDNFGRSSNVYRYPAHADTRGVSPASGSWTGGYPVVISGENLGNGGDITRVTLGGISATIRSQTVSRVWLTAGAALTPGPGDVVVQSVSYGTTTKSNAFTYTGAGIQVSGAAFAPTLLGRAVTNLFTVTNSGSEALLITAATNNGTGAGYFDVSAIPSRVEAGTASNFPVVFTPGAVGTFIPTCYTVNNSPNPNYSFGLTGSCFAVSTNVGPYAGGNTITITNGHFGTITNVLVGGVVAGIQASGANWVTITLPAVGSSGLQDLVIQTSDNGDITLANAYTYNPVGAIGGTEFGTPAWTNLGSGMSSTVNALAMLGTNLYAGGGFTNAGALAVNRMAMWNGSAWTNLGSGMEMGVNALTHDGTNLYAGGSFQNAGGLGGRRVAMWNGTSWTNLANGLSYDALSLLSAGTNLYAGYYNLTSRRSELTLWNGSSWSAATRFAGTGIGPGIYAFAPDGTNLYVGGRFITAPGVSTTNLAKWNGTAWTNMGSGFDSTVKSLEYAGGNLYAGGSFTNAGSVAVACVAKWVSGTVVNSGVSPESGSWTGGYPVVITGTNLGSGADITNVTICGVSATISSQTVSCVWLTAVGTQTPGLGDVVVHSTSYGTTTKSNAFTYTGADIEVSAPAFAPTLLGRAITNTFTVTNSGTEALLITAATNNGTGAGYFDVSAIPSRVEAGTASNFPVVFTPGAVGMFTPTCYVVNNSPTPNYTFGLTGSCFAVSTNVGPYAGGNTITITNGHFGNITNVLLGAPGSAPASLISSGSNWFTITLPPATNAGTVSLTVQTSDNGDTTLANAYTYNAAGEIGGTTDEIAWTALGSGLVGGDVYALAYEGTNLYAGGYFTNAGGVAASRIAQWNGVNWTNLGTGLDDDNVYALLPMGSNLYAGGGFYSAGGTPVNYIAKWNGANWTNLGGGMNGLVRALAHDGTNLYAGGQFSIAGGGAAINIAKWDGSSWTSLGSGVGAGYDVIYALAHDATNLYVGGYFTAAGGVAVSHIAKWNGASWTNLGTGVSDEVNALEYEGTNLFAGGLFTTAGGMSASKIAQWNGVSWTNLGSGMSANFFMHAVKALAHDGTNLYAGGSFTNAGGVSASKIAKWGSLVVEFSGVEPSSGSWTGGYPVVIRGSNLGNGSDITNVTLAGVAVQSIVSQSSTQIVVVARVTSAGLLGDVRVYSTSYGTTVKSNAFTYLRATQAALLFAPTDAQTYLTTNGLSASGGSGTGAVSYTVQSGPGLIVGGTNLAMLSGTGMVTVVATKAQDDLYFAASATAQVAAARAEQTLNFPAIDDQLTTNRVGLAATSSSGLSVSFSVFSGLASIAEGTNLTFTGMGSVRIVAMQAGDTNWLAAGSVTNAFTVSLTPQADLIFNPTSPQVYATTNALTSSGGSGPGLTSYVWRSGPGYVLSGVPPVAPEMRPPIMGGWRLAVTSGTGVVEVVATKSGNAIYAAQSVTGVVYCTRAGQTVDFTALDHQFWTNRIGLAATASSGLGPTFSVASGPASVANATNLSFNGYGAVVLDVDQAGDDNYLAAPTVTNRFSALGPILGVTGVSDFGEAIISLQTITNVFTFTNAGSAQLSIAGVVTNGAQASSFSLRLTSSVLSVSSVVHVPVIFDPKTGGTNLASFVITFDGTNSPYTVHVSGKGLGGGIRLDSLAQSYNAVYQGTNPVAQVIGLTNVGVSSFTYTNLITYSAGASGWLSSLPGGGTVGVGGSTLLTNRVTMAGLNAGTHSATVAVTAADATNSPQAFVATLLVAQAPQAISFPNPGNQWTTNVTPISATATSGLPVSFEVVSGPATLVDGTNVTYTASGTVVLRALQAGNSNWLAAASVTNSYDVAKTPQSALVFAPLSPQEYATVQGLSTSMGSGTGAVSYAVLYGVGQITGGTNLLATSGTGRIEVEATKASDAMYLVQTAVATVTVAKANQAITFAPIGDQFWTNQLGLAATASSTLTVAFAVSSGPATLSDATNLSFNGYGPVELRVDQAGDDNFLAAPTVTNRFNALGPILSVSGSADFGPALVGRQTITNVFVFTNAGSAPLRIASVVTNGAQASSFSLRLTSSVLSVSSVVHVPVVFDPQWGETNRASFVITFNGTNSPYTVDVTGFGLGGAIGFSTDVLAYTCTYRGADPADQSLTLTNSGSSAITWTNTIRYSAGAANWLAVTPAGGSLGKGSSVPLTAVVDATNLNAGTYYATNTVTAPEATNSPQTWVVTLVVDKAPQAITFPAISDQFVTNKVGLVATSSSGLFASFSVFSGPASLTDGTNLSFSATGAVSIVASQTGDTSWLVAPSVTNTFAVRPLRPAISGPFAVNTNVTTAGLGATINDVFGAPVTERGIVWSVTNGFAPETGTRVADLGLFGTGIFTQQVSNLVSGVTNFYRAYAVNHAGTSYTEQAWTLMRPEAPVPGPASDIQPNRFDLEWPVVRGATNTFIEVSEDELFASFVAGYQARVLGEAVTHTVTGLNAGVLYYYRLWAENAAGPSTNSVTGSVLTAPRLTILTWPREGGQTTPAQGNHIVRFGSPTQVTCAAYTGHRFAYWQGAGPITIADPQARTTTVTLLGNAVLTAYLMESNQALGVTYVAVRTNVTGNKSFELSVDAELCNVSTNGTRLTGPFWYSMPSNGYWSLRQPSGTNAAEGFSYLDVTAQMEALLGDGVLEPGECVVVTNILLGLRRSALPPPAIPAYLRALALPPLHRVDTDGDGLPDEVEEANPDWMDALNPLDGQADEDGDRQCNGDEWISGTDMTNGNSFLHIADAGLQGTGNLLVWPSVSGRLYSVSAATNILGPFLRLQSDIPATLPDTTFTDTVFSAEGKVFYRIEVRYP